MSTFDGKERGSLKSKVFIILPRIYMYFAFLILDLLTFRPVTSSYVATTAADPEQLTACIVLHKLYVLSCCFFVFRTFCLHNMCDKEEESLGKYPSNYFRLLVHTARSRGFLYSLAVIAPLSFIIGCGITFSRYSLNGVLYVVKAFAGMLIMCAVLLLAHTSANAYVLDVKRDSAKYSSIGEKKSFFIQIGYIAGIYYIFSYVLFLLYKSVESAVKILLFVVPGGIMVIPLSVIFILIYGKAYFERKKSVKAISKLCNGKKYTITKIKRPYMSLFKRNSGESFILTAGDKKYAFLQMSSVFKNSQICFRDDGTYRQKYFGKLGHAQLFSFELIHRYDFMSNEKKILLFCMEPLEFRAVDASGKRVLHAKENVGEYTLLTSAELIHTLSEG